MVIDRSKLKILFYALPASAFFAALSLAAEKPPAIAEPDCLSMLSELALGVRAKLNQLPPAPIDSPSIADGLHRLGQDLHKQGKYFEELKQLEAGLMSGAVLPSVAKSKAKIILEAVSREAEGELLRSGDPKARRVLEAHRLLFKRGERLFNRANYLETEAGKKEFESVAPAAAQQNDAKADTSSTKEQSGTRNLGPRPISTEKKISVRNQKFPEAFKDGAKSERWVTAVTTAPTTHFEKMTYDFIDTRTAEAEHRRSIPRAAGSVSHSLWVGGEDFVMPSGFLLASEQGENSKFPIPQITGDSVAQRFEMRNAIDVELGAEDLRHFTELDHPLGLSDLPEEFRKLVEQLQARHRRGGISDWEVSQQITKFIKDNYLYTPDETAESSVKEFLHSQNLQCRSDSLILSTVLRSFFRIPSVLLSLGNAFHDESTPGHWARVVGSSVDHMVSIVYDRAQKSWKIFDAQPIKKTRPFDEGGGESDSRFKKENLPNTHEEQADSKPSEEASKSAEKKAEPKKSPLEKLKDRVFEIFGGGKEEKKQESSNKSNESKEEPDDQKESKSPAAQQGTDTKGGKPGQAPKSLKGGSQSISLILKATFRDLWVNALRRNSSSKQLLDALVDYSRLARNFYREHPEMTYLKLNADRADELFEVISGLGLSYRDPEDFILSQIGKVAADPRPLKVFLETQKRIFDLLRAETPLTPEESRLNERVVEMLRKLTPTSGEASEAEVVSTFMQVLPGPLSRAAVKRDFPGGGSEVVSVPLTIDSLKSGKLADLLIMSRLKPYVRIPRFEILKPTFRQVDEGRKTPISNSDWTLAHSEDLSNRLKIYRDAPPHLDIKRLAAEDLLEQIHREPISRNHPEEKTPRIVDIVLYDISGSMVQKIEGQSRNPKAPMQTHLIAAFTDQSQIPVAEGKGTHAMYTIPFDGEPKPADINRSLSESQRYFDRLRQSPLQGSGGTQISAAILKALSLIQGEQGGSGELRRANILLLTDGGENGPMQIDEILRVRKEMNLRIPIALHVITLGEDNADLAALAKSPERMADLFHYSYQHLSYDEMNRIMEPSTRWKALSALSETARVEAHSPISNGQLISLKQDLVRRQSQQIKKPILVQDRKALLHFLETSSDDYSENAQAVSQLMMPILTILRSPGVAELSFETKFSLFRNFLQSASSELGVSQDDLLQMMPTFTKLQVKEALIFPEVQ